MQRNNILNRRDVLGASALLGAVVVFSIYSSAIGAGAALVEPVFVSGNASCASLGLGTEEFKIEGSFAGVYDIDGFSSITIIETEASRGDVFAIAFDSTIALDAVIMKAANGANVYIYDPEVFADEGILSTANPKNGKRYGLSHVSFCYDYNLDVEKTAETTYDREYQWGIQKSVSPEAHSLFFGDSAAMTYTVAVTEEGYVDSGWAVSGSISMSNSTPFTATVTNVVDSLEGDNIVVSCPESLPVNLASGEAMVCAYAIDLPDGADRVNTAMVATTGRVAGGEASADVHFGEPANEINASVTVTDTNVSDTWTFTEAGSATYVGGVACSSGQTEYVVSNTATIVETGASDSADVVVSCYDLVVSKTANPELTRQYFWDVQKLSDTQSVTLQEGESVDVTYRVFVGLDNPTSVESDPQVSGTITITNPNPVLAANITSVRDIVAPGIEASVSCSALPGWLAAGATTTCSYTTALPDTQTRVNRALAERQSFHYDALGDAAPNGFTYSLGEAIVNFVNADVTLLDETVIVSDTFAGILGSVTIGEGLLPKLFTYTHTLSGPDASCGETIWRNVANATANDTGAVATATADVLVNVLCEPPPPIDSCTLTIGYWKTHSEFGPAGYDATWGLLSDGASTLFAGTGRTWYEVFWTPIQTNAYYQLAHQDMAAYLNSLNGAPVPDEVVDAMNHAWTDLLTQYDGNPYSMSQIRGKVRKDFVETAEILDAYNNGLLGVPHCG